MVHDPHTHAWGPPSPEHPWTNGPLVGVVDGFSVSNIYTAEDLLADMDRVGIDTATVVGYPICDYRDNWYTLECVREHDRLEGIVMIDPFDDGAPDQIRETMTVDGVHGFRIAPLCPLDGMWETFDRTSEWLLEAIEQDAVWEAARETDAVVQLLAHVEQLDQCLELVETYPELRYLFDHFGHADPSRDPADAPFSDFADFTEYDVAVKVSEAVHHSEEDYPFGDLHDHVRWYLEEFGKERVIWGSDFPNVSDAAEYEQTLSWLDHVEGLSSGDREWLTERAYDRFVRQ